MNIYVGNLPYNASEDQLRELFEQFGPVASLRIIKDKFTGNAKGFAFVEMVEAEHGAQAVEQLNGKEFGGRTLRVNEAREREERPPRSNNGGGYGERRFGGGGRPPRRGGF